MMKIVAGIHEADGGEMLWQGRPVRFRNPAEATQNGIAMVHQESLLAPHLSIAENIFLGREERLPFGWVNRRKMTVRAADLIARHNFPLNAEWRVEQTQSRGEAACRDLQGNPARFESPDFRRADFLSFRVRNRRGFPHRRALRDRNMGVIYITHRLEELRSVGDRVTVLRDGETVHAGPFAELSMDSLIQHMVGREVASIYRREAAASR